MKFQQIISFKNIFSLCRYLAINLHVVLTNKNCKLVKIIKTILNDVSNYVKLQLKIYIYIIF